MAHVILGGILLGVSMMTAVTARAAQEDATSQRDLVIILPGLGDSREGRRHMAKFGEEIAPRGFDVLVPEYIARRGVEQTVANLRHVLDQAKLDHYHKVHFFSYIIGTWSLNLVLKDKVIPNLGHIVSDRSPLQERAPAVVSRRIGLPTRIMMGRVVKDFSRTPYPPLHLPPDTHIGLLIENRATSLIRMFKNTTLAMGPLSWDPADLHQPHHDLLFTPLNHDEMYVNFDVIGPELLHFFQTGRFSDGARRTPLPGDPFRKHIGE